MLTFWALAAVLAAGVTFLVTRPLRAPAITLENSPSVNNDAVSDLAVYRDQLAEIDLEAGRGALSAEDAAAARLEISRRMLARADRETTIPLSTGKVPALAPLLAAVGVPLLGLGFYLWSGVPWMPDQPRSARLEASTEQADVSQLISRVEERIAKTPDDGRGWDVIAPVYLKQARFADAVRAYENAVRLLGDSVPRLSGLAEAQIKAANGVVTDAAKASFNRVLAIEPTRIEPRFWLALALEQDGKLKEAATAYRALLDSAPADAPWRAPVLERLAAVDPTQAKQLPPPKPERGPTADDMAAAGQMTPEARTQMIAGMVAGLEQRLASDGRDADGWQKLIRAYVVMGNKDKARAALRNAQAALTGNKDGLAAVNAAAKELGVGS